MKQLPAPFRRAALTASPAPGSRKYLRLLASLACLAMVQTGCIMYPYVGNTKHDHQNFAATPLVTINGGEAVVYLLERCAKAYPADTPIEVQGCEKTEALRYLAVNPKDWNLKTAVTAFLASPSASYNPLALPAKRFSIKYGSYARPATAVRNTNAQFVGVFDDMYIWVSAADPRRYYLREEERWVFEQAFFREMYSSSTLTPRASALVVRDGSNIWLFAERQDACDDKDMCFTVSETLGTDASSLSEHLRRGFMLFHADVRPGGKFRRVVREDLAGFLNNPDYAQILPSAGEPFTFDFDAYPRSVIKPYDPEVGCVQSERMTGMVTCLLIPLPFSQGCRESLSPSRSFLGCTQLTEGPPTSRLRAAPLRPLPKSDPTDPFIRSQRDSTYYCSSTPAPGQLQEGDGPHGCSFVLRDTKTGRPLPRTPYLIALDPERPHLPDAAAPALFKGITDEHGRTAFVRDAEPMTFDRVQVVRRLVSRAEFRKDPDPALTKRYDWCEDERAKGSPLRTRFGYNRRGEDQSGTVYRIQLCSGELYQDVTDERSWIVAVDEQLSQDCPIRHLSLPGWCKR